ncbi:hypothetical protein V8E36_008895 [Tilletia maclaganii]
MSKQLNIVIAGAGLAGLAAASALAGQQHKVTVLERKTVIEEVAYAINLKPNAAKTAYGTVGLDEATVRGNPCNEIIERSATDGEVRMHKPVDAPKEFGGPWYFCQRTQLHSALYKSALERGVAVELGAQVSAVDVGDSSRLAQVKLADGKTYEADLVLVADGIGSRLRNLVLQDDVDYRWDSGQVAYRAFVPVERLANSPDLAWLTRADAGGLYVWADMKQRVVVYPCPGHVNIVAIVDKDFLKAPGSLDVPRTKPTAELADEMRAQFEGFEPLAAELLSLAPTASLWPLHDVSPLPFYERGRALLIGDAAHATLPHQGQGASLAFEDAEGLAYLFKSSDPTFASDIPNTLAFFTQVRKERVHAIQHFSRVMAAPANYEKGDKLDALRFAGQTLTYNSISELINSHKVPEPEQVKANVTSA